jgi:hypothetical protein
MWFVASLLAGLQTVSAAPAARLAFGHPTVVTTIAVLSEWGPASRLAWSPDGRTLYLRFTKRDTWGNERHTHFLLALRERQLKPAEGEPDWAAAYWAWKSAPAAPGVPAFHLDVETRQERKTATGVVSAGSMAQSGGDPSLGAGLGPQGQAIAQGAMQAQMVTTTTLKVKGELVGEYVNEPVAAGRTFGWAPAGLDALVVVSGRHRLKLISATGQKQELTNDGGWLLPAWSPDGRQLACVKTEGKKTISVQLLAVSGR